MLIPTRCLMESLIVVLMVVDTNVVFRLEGVRCETEVGGLLVPMEFGFALRCDLVWDGNIFDWVEDDNNASLRSG